MLNLKQDKTLARRFIVTGQVQGVGYRPFVYRLAHKLNLNGWVRNVTGSVEIHAEGSAENLDQFANALIREAPAIAKPVLAETQPAELENHETFSILESESGKANIHVPPDYFVCEDCLREMREPGNRRHHYPFINCTQCGPRYTLIESLPYDRPATSMKAFAMCPECGREYSDPLDRRFHAEPIACPACGPQLVFAEPDEAEITGNEAALEAAARYLRDGSIVAVKGIGGYHLLCDACNDEAIARLRMRKARPSKPLAVMFPADGKGLMQAVECDAEQLAFLQSPQRPILLLPKRRHCEEAKPTRQSRNFAEPCLTGSPRRFAPRDDDLGELVAPGLNEIGCMLPYSPLHALLLDGFGGPLVATSGNVSGEPVITDNTEAQSRLQKTADAFLHHNRPIIRPADDSVFRMIAGKPRPLRLGRGIAPLELQLSFTLPEAVLALGAHTKNAIALAWENRVVLSPHIADLSSVKSLDTLAQVAEDLQRLYQVKADRLLIDQHPGYGYRRFARESGLPVSEVWHHHAHASSLALEFPQVENWIVFAWDGVGLGEDGALWGGETFTGNPGNWHHAATLRPFRLPGGEQAGREPWRSAAALLWETEQHAPFAPELLHEAWLKGINAPATHAAGRLFDAAAALTSICTHASFEGEGPMKLEAAANQYGACAPVTLPLKQTNSITVIESEARQSRMVDEASTTGLLRDARNDETQIDHRISDESAESANTSDIWQTDWSPLLPMLTDSTIPAPQRAACFHASMAHALLEQAQQLRQQTGIANIGLTGGVFQNRLLAESAILLLQQHSFTVHFPEKLPVNDAGICLGQIMEFIFSDSTT